MIKLKSFGDYHKINEGYGADGVVIIDSKDITEYDEQDEDSHFNTPKKMLYVITSPRELDQHSMAYDVFKEATNVVILEETTMPTCNDEEKYVYKVQVVTPSGEEAEERGIYGDRDEEQEAFDREANG